MSLRKKAERTVDFTEEFIAQIPVGRHYQDFWYDKERPYLAVRRIKSMDNPVTFHVRTNIAQRLAARKITGTFLGQYLTLGAVSLAQARIDGEKVWSDLQAQANQHRMSSGPIAPDRRDALAEAIFDEKTPTDNPSYEGLMNVLMDAYAQAANGKGLHRHGNGLDFEDQDMLAVMDRVGINFALGQAMKKMVEGRRLTVAEAREEFLGAIVYLAGAIIWMEKRANDTPAPASAD